MDKSADNPLINPPKLKYDAVPYHLIKIEHFKPAADHACTLAKQELTSIETNPDSPTFENTILALECVGSQFSRIMWIYSILKVMESDNDFKNLTTSLFPPFVEFRNSIFSNKKLFDRVRMIYENRFDLSLTTEQIRLVENQYDTYHDNGIHLGKADQDEVKAIQSELNSLRNQFEQHVHNATNKFEYTTFVESELAGIPESDKAMMAQTAKDKGHVNAWTILLQRPFRIAVLTYASNRKLRERIYKEFRSIAFEDKYDNQNIILKIVQLSHRQAQILGYPTYADYILKDRMVKSVAEVKAFLDSYLQLSKPLAVKELEQLKALACELDGLEDFQAWDEDYYEEKLKRHTQGFDSEMLKPYFKLENVVQGLFSVSQKLYGLKFTLVTDVPVYHPDVQVYQVSDENNDYLGLLMLDLFIRETKVPGFRAGALLGQGWIDGKMRRPHVSIGGSLMPGIDERPSLLTKAEVSILFHEFGHGLHEWLSQCSYSSMAGIRVNLDFKELPSQIMENWTFEKDALDLFAFHYETGETIPPVLLEQLKTSRTFMAGRYSLSLSTMEFLDLAWYSVNPEEISSVREFEAEILSKTQLLPLADHENRSCSFRHCFSSGYAAGFYSYRWGEVLDADAFELFKEKGIFNREVAQSFRDNILAKGDSEPPMDLYIKFRGRKPDPEALLRRNGLIALK